MGFVSYPETSQTDESIRPSFEGLERKLGQVPAMYRALAHNPDLYSGFMTLNGAMGKTELDPKLRELAYLRASQINGCDYCMHYHTKSARKVGLTEEQVAHSGDEAPGESFEELQWDVLRFADQVTRRARADRDLMERLKAKLSDRQLVELTATVALANFTNRFNETLDIELP